MGTSHNHTVPLSLPLWFVRQKKVPPDVENDHQNISLIAGNVWQEMMFEEKACHTMSEGGRDREGDAHEIESGI